MAEMPEFVSPEDEELRQQGVNSCWGCLGYGAVTGSLFLLSRFALKSWLGVEENYLCCEAVVWAVLVAGGFKVLGDKSVIYWLVHAPLAFRREKPPYEDRWD